MQNTSIFSEDAQKQFREILKQLPDLDESRLEDLLFSLSARFHYDIRDILQIGWKIAAGVIAPKRSDEWSWEGDPAQLLRDRIRNLLISDNGNHAQLIEALDSPVEQVRSKEFAVEEYRVTPEKKEMLRLWLDGYNWKEVAAKMEKPVNTIYRWRHEIAKNIEKNGK